VGYICHATVNEAFTVAGAEPIDNATLPSLGLAA
jgi:hypothetical protein